MNSVATITWPQLSLGVAGLSATLFIYFHKIKADRKAQRKKKRDELSVWVAEIRHYAEKREPADVFIKEFQARCDGAASKCVMAEQEFPKLSPILVAMGDALRKYVDWVTFERAFGDVRGSHGIGENQSHLDEIIRLANQFDAEVEAKVR